MNSKNIQQINEFRSKKFKNKSNLSKDRINTYAWKFIEKSFKSKSSFHDYFHLNALKNEIGGNLYEILGDLFIIDGARGKIVVNDKQIDYVNGIIQSMPNAEVIKSRCDNFHKENIKDKAIVYALKGGESGRNFGELRIQTIKENYEGEFGEFAHFKYKRRKLNELKNSVSNNQNLKIAAKNLCDSLNVDYVTLFD